MLSHDDAREVDDGGDGDKSQSFNCSHFAFLKGRVSKPLALLDSML